MNRLTTIITWFCYIMLSMAVLTFILMVLNNVEVKQTFDSPQGRAYSNQDRMAMNELVLRTTK